MRQYKTKIEQRGDRWYWTARRRGNDTIAACGFGKSEQHAQIAIEATDSRDEGNPPGASGETASGAQEAPGSQGGQGQTCMTSRNVLMVSPGAEVTA